MTNALDLDLQKLNARAFDRAEWAVHCLGKGRKYAKVRFRRRAFLIAFGRR